MKKTCLLILIVLLSVSSFAQGHFVVAFTGNGQDHMNINIITATIGGVALEAGDEIAAFDGSICCGKIVLNHPIVISDINTFASIAASQKDDGSSNGYTAGNPIFYKFWDSNKNKELSGITADYLDPLTAQPTSVPTYTIDGSAFVKLSVSAPVNQSPASNAGTDQSVNEGDYVILDGSASSDPDGDQLSYKWTAPAGIILNSTSIAKPTFTAPLVSVNTDYTFSLIVNDGMVDSSPDQVVVTVKNIPDILLQLSVLLEGAYNGTGLMNTTLKTNNLIPLLQPYRVAPWNYAGTENVSAIPAGVVDWVLVEVRQAASAALATPSTILTKRAAFLKSDGTIVDLDGTSLLNIGNPIITNSLYVVVRHRNHLAIMSSTGAVLNNNNYAFDFTTGVSQAFGGVAGYKLLGSGVNTKAVMVAGDIDAEGSIFGSDFAKWAINSGTTGVYNNSDLDFDGNIFGSDFAKWAINSGTTNPITKAASIVTGTNDNSSAYSSQVPE